MNGETLQLFQQQISESNDRQAYKTWNDGCFAPLFSFARSIVRSNETAEEIVSDLFIRLWEQRERLNEVQNLRVYLYASVRNACLNYLSKKNREIITYFDNYEVETPAIESAPDELVISSEMKKKIAHAIDTLPPRCKMIFRFIREDGLKYKEVAEIMDISVNTIDAQMAIAVKRVAQAVNLDFIPNKSYFK